MVYKSLEWLYTSFDFASAWWRLFHKDIITKIMQHIHYSRNIVRLFYSDIHIFIFPVMPYIIRVIVIPNLFNGCIDFQNIVIINHYIFMIMAFYLFFRSLSVVSTSFKSKYLPQCRAWMFWLCMAWLER
jgi:hypothetical protein